MIVKIVALLGILAACSQGFTINDVKFAGQSSEEGYYILNDHTAGKNTFTVVVTAEEADAGKKIELGVYKKEEAVVKPKQVELKKGTQTVSLPLTSLQVTEKVSYVELEARAKAVALPSLSADPAPKPYNLYVLNVKQGSVPTYQVQVSPHPACSSKLDISSPSTYPPLRAKCGVWLVKKTDSKDAVFATNPALVYDSEDKNSKWNRKVEDTVQLSLNVDSFNLKPIGDEKDQSDKDKFIKCEFSYYDKEGAEVKSYPYIADVVEQIKLETTGDLCGANPFDKLWNKEGNKHVKPTNQEKGASCYLKDGDLPNILSDYKCEDDGAEKHTISTFCEHENYVWKYDINQGSLIPWNETEGLSFITECLDMPETLKDVEVMFKGPFKFVVTSEPDQTVSCSFNVNKTEVPEKGTVDATMTIHDGDKQLCEKTAHVARVKDQDVIHVESEEYTLKEDDIKADLNLTCKVKLGNYNRAVVGEENLVPVIEVHPEADYTRVHVDSDKCEVNIKKISRSYTKPQLLAICGIWTANSTENFKYGEWLDEEDVTFNSENGTWSNHTWNNDPEYLQYYLENKTIPIDKLSSDDINWFRCTFEALDSNDEPMGTFSEVVQRVVSHNMADECSKNPLESIDVSKYNVKLIYNEEVASCFSGNVKVHPSITAKCNATANFYSVNCEEKAYVINDGNKKEKYSEEKMKKLLKEGCNAGTVLLVSNSLLAALAALLFFKSS